MVNDKGVMITHSLSKTGLDRNKYGILFYEQRTLTIGSFLK